MMALRSGTHSATEMYASQRSVQRALDAISPQATLLLRMLSTFTGWATLDSIDGIAGIAVENSRIDTESSTVAHPVGSSLWMAELIDAEVVERKDSRLDVWMTTSEPELFRVCGGADKLICPVALLSEQPSLTNDQLLSAHHDWFIARVESLGARLNTRHESAAQKWLDLEFPEYLTVIDCLIDEDPLRALGAVNRLGDFWASHGQTRSGARLLKRVLGALGEDVDDFSNGSIEVVRGKSLLAHIQLRAETLSTLDEYRRWLEMQLEVALADSSLSHRDQFAIALHLVFAAMVDRDYEASIRTAERCRDLAVTLGDDFHAANFNFYLARVTEQTGDNARAIRHVDRAIAHAQRTGNDSFLGACISQRTVLLKEELGPAKVVETLRPIVETHLLHRRVKDAAFISVALALAQFQINERVEALQTLRRALSLSNCARSFDGELTCAALITFSDLSAESTPESVERCVRLYGGIRHHLGRFRAIITPGYVVMVDNAIERLKSMLSGAQLERIIVTAPSSWPEVIAQADAFAADQLEALRKAAESDGSQTQTPAEQIEAGTAALVEREYEVLALLLRGKSDKRIAEKLGLRPNTVRSYNSRIFRKFGLASRSELLALHVSGR